MQPKLLSGAAIVAVAIGITVLTKTTPATPTTQETTATTTQKEESQSTSETSKATPTSKATKPDALTSGYSTYKNAVYGFSIKYPTYVKVRDEFFPFHEMASNWRLYPNITNQGKPLASFSIYNLDQGAYSTGKEFFPLFFASEVRIGISDNTRDCYAQDQGFTNQKVTQVTINGTTFKKFSTSDAAMMKYIVAESYRTIRNNKCYVLEQIKNGSTYRDEKMKPGISEDTLTKYYNTGESIIRTFRFN